MNPLRAVAMGAVLLISGFTDAQVTFTKIADQGTPIPGGAGTFTGFAHPALTGGRLLFAATGIGQQGLYEHGRTGLSVIVDRGTLVPGTQSHFYEASAPAVDGDHFAFKGYYSQTGIFSNLGGLHAVITTGTLIQTPIGPRQISSVGEPSVAGADVTTFIACTDYQAILLARPNETLIVADSAPGSQFSGVGQPALGADFTAFLGCGAHGSGVFRARQGEIAALVRSGDPVPGWDGLFTSFTYLTARGDEIAFLGRAESAPEFRTGIYAYRAGRLELVADTGTQIPGTTAVFEDFSNYGQPSVGDGTVAFGAGGDGIGGLYVQREGELLKILDSRDILDGKRVRHVSLGPYGLYADDLAFVVMFDDMSSAVYVARIPEPSTAPVLVVLAGLLMLRRGRLPV